MDAREKHIARAGGVDNEVAPTGMPAPFLSAGESAGRRVADRVMRLLARLLIHVFFRHVEVEGAHNLPSDRPTLLVANHQNGLVDGLLLISALERYPCFLGKSTLWKILPLRPFLALAGVIPVYRSADGEATSRNSESFAVSRRMLAQGRVVAVFPEGISHDEAALQPLRTGAARIALGAAVDDGTPGVVCVPVGLTYDAKARFRSRALLRIGPPIPVDRWAAEDAVDDRATVRDMTTYLATSLEQVSPTYVSWQQGRALNRIAAIATRPLDRALPADIGMAPQEQIARLLAVAEDRRPDLVAEVRRATDAYEKDLTLLGLTDRQIAASYDARRVRWAAAWEVIKVIVALPPAVVGVVVHVVPYRIVKWLATKPTNEGIKATVKLLGCFAGFVATYVALGIVVGRWLGVAAGLAVFVACPVCGYATVRLAERILRLGGLVEGYRAVRGAPAALTTALADRGEVVRLVEAAAASDGEQRDP